MGDNIKKIGIRNDSGEYTYTDIGVDADKVDIDNTTLDQKISTIETNITNHTTALGNKVDKVSGKGLSTNDYTTTEKTKLSGIAEGAEVNQNAFANVVVGSTTIAADAKSDSLTLVAGSNVTITPDATNDKITISSTDTTYDLATTTTDGLMSKEDKSKIENLLSAGSVTGIKGNAESEYRTGDVNLTAENIGALPAKIISTANALSNYTITGVYHIANSYLVDKPSASQGTLIVEFEVGTPYQLWIPDNLNTIFKRTFTDNVWSDWSKITSGKSDSAINVVDYNDASNLIQVGYAKEALTADTFKYFAGYTYDGDSSNVRIKNVSIQTVLSLLGIHCDLYTGDLNDIAPERFSIFNTEVGTDKNSPTASWGFVITLGHVYSNTFRTQLFLGMTTHDLYYRICVNSSWNDWIKIPFAHDVPTGGGIEFQMVNGELQYRYDTEVWE